MEAVVIDAGSKLLKAGPAVPDQAPAMVAYLNIHFSFCPSSFFSAVSFIPVCVSLLKAGCNSGRNFSFFILSDGYLNSMNCAQIIPTQMKRVLEEGSSVVGSAVEDVTVDPVERGFIRDWDAMEDMLQHVLYTGLGWEEGNEGQILFTDPLSTPKVWLVLVIFFIVITGVISPPGIAA